MRLFALTLITLLAGCRASPDSGALMKSGAQLEQLSYNPLFPSDDETLQEALRSLDWYLLATSQGYEDFSQLEKIEWMLALMSDPAFTADLSCHPLLSRALELRPDTIAGTSWEYWASVALALKLNEDSPQEQDLVRSEFGISALSPDSAQARSLLQAFEFLNTSTSQ